MTRETPAIPDVPGLTGIPKVRSGNPRGRRTPLEKRLGHSIQAALVEEPYAYATRTSPTLLQLVVKELVLEAARGNLASIRMMLSLVGDPGSEGEPPPPDGVGQDEVARAADAAEIADVHKPQTEASAQGIGCTSAHVSGNYENAMLSGEEVFAKEQPPDAAARGPEHEGAAADGEKASRHSAWQRETKEETKLSSQDSQGITRSGERVSEEDPAGWKLLVAPQPGDAAAMSDAGAQDLDKEETNAREERNDLGFLKDGLVCGGETAGHTGAAPRAPPK